MTIDEMNKCRRELGMSYQRIADASGLPVGTVQKVLGGITKSPRYNTLQALEKVLNPRQIPVDMVREVYGYGTSETRRQGEYTIEDYDTVPCEHRVELIDGVIYDMAAPTDIHQILVTQIWMLFAQHIKNKKGNCVPIVSPIDVQLDCDDYTVLQPDVIVICDRKKLRGRIYGSPDLVVEILSPSSRKLDNVIKRKKYEAAGVKEYWIVDPKNKKILVYNYMEAGWPIIYGFEERIPVHIFAEPCELDFSEVNEYLRSVYEESTDEFVR